MNTHTGLLPATSQIFRRTPSVQVENFPRAKPFTSIKVPFYIAMADSKIQYVTHRLTTPRWFVTADHLSVPSESCLQDLAQTSRTLSPLNLPHPHQPPLLLFCQVFPL